MVVAHLGNIETLCDRRPLGPLARLEATTCRFSGFSVGLRQPLEPFDDDKTMHLVSPQRYGSRARRLHIV
jgi:hypothetical protein